MWGRSGGGGGVGNLTLLLAVLLHKVDAEVSSVPRMNRVGQNCIAAGNL